MRSADMAQGPAGRQGHAADETGRGMIEDDLAAEFVSDALLEHAPAEASMGTRRNFRTILLAPRHAQDRFSCPCVTVELPRQHCCGACGAS